MRNLRRFFCFLLALLTLSSTVLAADIVFPSPGSMKPGGGGGSMTSWATNLDSANGAGLLLHVQSSNADLTFDRSGNPTNFGDIVGYWTTHFPNTDPDSGQTGIYLIPNWSIVNYSGEPAAIQLAAAEKDYDAYGIQYIPMLSPNENGKNWAGFNAMGKAVGWVSEANPNFNLPADYWQKWIASTARGDCANIVTQLFSPQADGFTNTSQVTSLNARVEKFLGLDGGINSFSDAEGRGDLKFNGEEQRAVGLFMNYCGLLAYVIKCLPQTEQEDLAQRLDAMCQSYLSGGSYRPMVVTGEMIISTNFFANGGSRYWWTPRQVIYHQSGVNVGAGVEGRSDVDPVHYIGQTKNRVHTGAEKMYGTIKDGVGWVQSTGNGTVPVQGTAINSVSEAQLSKYGISNKPIPGFGVWGLSVNFTQPVVIPTVKTASEQTANGVIGLEVDATYYNKDVGDYSETVTVTVPITLNASFAQKTTTDGVVTADDHSGPGFGGSLKWLARKRDAGFSFPDPTLRVWLKSSDPVPAISGDAAKQLLDDSYGYIGTGTSVAPTDAHPSGWDPAAGEAATGVPFKWNKVMWEGTSSMQLPQIEGMSYTINGDELKFTFSDLWAAAEYFEGSNPTFNIIVEVPINGTLEDENAVNQHWYRSGSRISMSGPASVDDLNSVQEMGTMLYSRPKYAYTTVSAKPEEKPFYYSKVQPAYSELKQGTVPMSGGGSSEKFNSMAGTPTFTETNSSTRPDFTGTPYAGDGHFYQFFASGGSEFVVQFDGEYVQTANASRTYTATFSNTLCDNDKGPCQAPHTHGSDPPSPCSTCHQTHGCTHNTHQVGDTYTWTQNVTGFSYVKIINLKVWKLSEARLDGTRELLDTDEVKATVMSNAPDISYNIASADTSAEGRLVYSYEPAQKDAVTIPGYPKTSDRSCDSHTDKNQKTLDGDTKSVTCEAVCVSDFIVLHTSNGDQSILYYEYKSKNKAKINTGNCVAEDIEFDEVPYATIWTSNGQTSEGAKMKEDDITYGGYNGNYSSMSTKYQSSGNPSKPGNITWSGTTAYKNTSKVYGSKSNSALYTQKVTQKFRLMNDKLIIPDYKQNGEYIVGNSEVFYENIVNFGPSVPNYPIVTQANFGNKKGFTMSTTYSPSHGKINDVVVYNPVSNQYAIIVSLPDERDQRIATHVTPATEKSALCPGDASCEYLKNVCTITNHLHDENCYTLLQYEVHGPNNVHEHTSECSGIACSPSSPCMTTGTHVSSNCPNGHSCNGCTVCHVCEQNGGGGGGWYVTHGDGCTYEGVTHFTTSQSECTTCGHSCGGTYTSAYACNNLPLNKHVCGASGAASTGHLWYHNDGGCTYSGQYHISTSASTCTACSHTCGSYLGELKSTGSGSSLYYCSNHGYGIGGVSGCSAASLIGTISMGSAPAAATVACYTMYKSQLACSDPHHAFSYNWKIYTYGLKHTSGTICSGRSCSDTSALVFPTQKTYTLAECANGYLVRHTNGNVHLTTSIDRCTYCGAAYKELAGNIVVMHADGTLHMSDTTGGTCTTCGDPYVSVQSNLETTDRTPDPSEYSCYTYGDNRCWAPCNDPAQHQKVILDVVDNGTTYTIGKFINLDYGFQIFFPNTGDFRGTGEEYSSTTTPERGKGYENGMDATIWTKTKWVEFPFDVVYNDTTYLAYERIYLEVPEKWFYFYVPLSDNEMANAEIKFGSVAINTQNGEALECGVNRDHNIETISYSGKRYAHHHNADKRFYIDVVGRIGNLAMEDTGDFRFSNLFKQSVSGWIVKNIVHKVDTTRQNYILLDQTDIRGVPVGITTSAGDTYGNRTERSHLTKVLGFPLTPSMNNIEALRRQPIRVGYDSYFDLETLGNYYGNTVYEGGVPIGQNLLLIKPRYFRLDLDNGMTSPVDVYMDVNGNKVLINDHDSYTVTYNGVDAQVNLNWVEEYARRNYNGAEVTSSEAVASANEWVMLPHGSSWIYGNYNLLNLTQRNRTFVGTEYTYTDAYNDYTWEVAEGTWNPHKDPSNRINNTFAAMQGGRWHFNIGLPSSAVFVYSGQEPSQANIDSCRAGSAVVVCALEIYAQGEVWTLAYDGSDTNKPFQVVPNGPIYDPKLPYPPGKITTPDDPDDPDWPEMPIVQIISIDHSSKEDLNVAGTH